MHTQPIPGFGFLTLVLCVLGGLFASCGPEQGERRMDEAFWDKGPPPILRFKGEKVFWEGDWVNDGPATYFDEMGREIGKGSFDLGKESGEWTLEEDGFTGRGLFQNGQRHARWTYTYPSGKVQEEGRYELGKREGEWKTYYSNGDLQAIRVYVNGKLKGQPETWDTEGRRN